MKEYKKNEIARRRNGGYVLLMLLLLGVVIGVLIYFMRAGSPVALDKGDKPWNEWESLQKEIEKEPLPKPNENQPVLSKMMMFENTAVTNGEERGELSILLNTNGNIEGGWGGKYMVNKDEYEIMGCKLKGFVVATKIYKDEQGNEDPSKLYFIAKGPFTLLKWGDKVRSVLGQAYVTGWIDKEYNAVGKLTLTSDKINAQVFEWQSGAKEPAFVKF